MMAACVPDRFKMFGHHRLPVHSVCPSSLALASSPISSNHGHGCWKFDEMVSAEPANSLGDHSWYSCRHNFRQYALSPFFSFTVAVSAYRHHDSRAQIQRKQSLCLFHSSQFHDSLRLNAQNVAADASCEPLSLAQKFGTGGFGQICWGTETVELCRSLHNSVAMPLANSSQNCVWTPNCLQSCLFQSNTLRFRCAQSIHRRRTSVDCFGIAD